MSTAPALPPDGFQPTDDRLAHLLAYRDGRSDGRLHAAAGARLAPASRRCRDSCHTTLCAGEAGEWYLLGYCSSLTAYPFAC